MELDFVIIHLGAYRGFLQEEEKGSTITHYKVKKSDYHYPSYVIEYLTREDYAGYEFNIVNLTR